MSKLLEEPPLIILPSLACAIGLNEAVVLQQLYFLLRNPKNGKRIAEHKWIFNTYEQWQVEYFPFWSAKTIQRIFSNLANMRLVVWCQPEGKVSRRKYYRIDEDRLKQITDKDKLSSSNGTHRPVKEGHNGTLLPTETTFTETSSQRGLKETEVSSSASDAENVSFPAKWKPRKQTKEQQLAAIDPKGLPSQEQFEEFLIEEGLDNIECYRPDLYGDLTDVKFHQWRPKGNRWVKIRDWKAYVRAFDEKLGDAKNSGF